MSLNERIISTVTPVVPICVPDFYDGDSPEYCTFHYFERPDEFADDIPSSIRYSVQLHFFTPIGNNPEQRKKDLKKTLFRNGFSYPSITNASDDQYQHYVLECEYVEEVDLDGDL